MERSWMDNFCKLILCGLAYFSIFSYGADQRELPELERVKISIGLILMNDQKYADEIYHSGLLSFDTTQINEEFRKEFDRRHKPLAYQKNTLDPNAVFKNFNIQVKKQTIDWLRKEGIANVLFPQGRYVPEKILWLNDEEIPELFPVVVFFEEYFDTQMDPLVFVVVKAAKVNIRPTVFLYSLEERALRPWVQTKNEAMASSKKEIFSFGGTVKVGGVTKFQDRLLKEVYLSNAVLTADPLMYKESPDAYLGAILHSMIHYHQQQGLLTTKEVAAKDEEDEAKEIAAGWKSIQNTPHFKDLLAKELPIYGGQEVLALKNLKHRFVASNVALTKILRGKEETLAIEGEVCFLKKVRGLGEEAVVDHFQSPARAHALALEYRVSTPEAMLARPAIARRVSHVYSKCDNH